LTNKACT